MQLNIREILLEEAANAVAQIKENIPSVTGYTANSIRAEADDNSLTIYGASYIDTLQTGISPQRSIADWDLRRLQGLLYQWADAKGISFESKKDRWWFAVNTANIQQELGSLMWRSQAKADIYDTPAEQLVSRIKERVSNAIIDYKILK